VIAKGYGSRNYTFDQQAHPEIKPGEFWVTNASARKEFDPDSHYARCKSLRKGKVAFDMYGKEVPGSVPVFVDHEEWLRVANAPKTESNDG